MFVSGNARGYFISHPWEDYTSVYMYCRHKRFHTLFDLLKYGLMLKYNVMCSSLDPMEELTASPPYPIPQLEQDVGMGHLSSHPLPQTGNPGSITEIECTLLSGSAEQDALQ